MSYYKEINGQNVWFNNVIINNDKLIINPPEDLILAEGWIKYIPPVYKETIEDIKRFKIGEIKLYDQSSEVNEFYIHDLPVWLDKETRVGLRLRFESETAVGKTETTLWYNNMQFPLQLEDAINMLHAIELYASACYDNTQAHLANVEKLTTEEEIKEYDFRTGYPEKLRF